MNPEDMRPDEAQSDLDAVPVTVDEAINLAVADLNANATLYEPLGETVDGTLHVETITRDATVPGWETVEGDSEHYVETPNAEYGDDEPDAQALADAEDALGKNDQSFWDTVAIRPPFILSFVESDHQYGGFVVGWDTCGACNLHLRSCTCKNGPEQPKYVKSWRPAADKNHDKPQAVTQEVKKAIVAADPQAVEKAVDEALTTPTGRKKRADAGKPRGPRKKGTPDSVLEAAGDLSAAMSKGN